MPGLFRISQLCAQIAYKLLPADVRKFYIANLNAQIAYTIAQVKTFRLSNLNAQIAYTESPPAVKTFRTSQLCAQVAYMEAAPPTKEFYLTQFCAQVAYREISKDVAVAAAPILLALGVDEAAGVEMIWVDIGSINHALDYGNAYECRTRAIRVYFPTPTARPTIAEIRCYHGSANKALTTNKIEASSEAAGYEKGKACDGSVNTRWQAETFATPQYLILWWNEIQDFDNFIIKWGQLISGLTGKLQYLDESQRQNISKTVMADPIELAIFVVSGAEALDEQSYEYMPMKISMSGEATVSYPHLNLLVPPNWAEPVKVSLSYKTFILPSARGGEQRSWNRDLPRIKISYRGLVSTSEMHGLFLSALRRKLNDICQVPIWPDEMRLSADVNAADTIIPIVSTSMRRLKIGSPVFFVKDELIFEWKRAQDFDENSIILESGLDNNWFANSTVIFPGIDAYMVDLEWIRKLTDTVHEAELKYEETTV